MTTTIKIQQNTLVLLIGVMIVLALGSWGLFGFGQSNQTETIPTTAIAGPNIVGNAQDIYLRALSNGTYDKSELRVKTGQPVRLHFTADTQAGCGRYLAVNGLNIGLLSKNGEEVVADFTPTQTGVYTYTCSMGMFRPGKLVIE